MTSAERPENQHIYHMYVIQAPGRDELQAWLKERGIGTGIHYPVPIHLQKSMDNLGEEKVIFLSLKKSWIKSFLCHFIQN